MCQDCHDTGAAFAAMEASAARRADGGTDQAAKAGPGGVFGWIARYYPVAGEILTALEDAINRRRRGAP